MPNSNTSPVEDHGQTFESKTIMEVLTQLILLVRIVSTYFLGLSKRSIVIVLWNLI